MKKLTCFGALIVVGVGLFFVYKRAVDNGFDYDAQHDATVIYYQEQITSKNKIGPHFTELMGISSDRTRPVECLYEYRQQVRKQKLRSTFLTCMMTERETSLCEEKLKRIIAESSEIHVSYYGEPLDNKIIECSEISDLLSTVSNHHALTSNVIIIFPMEVNFGLGTTIIKLLPTNLEIALCSDLEIRVWGNSFQVARTTVSPEFYGFLVDIWCANPSSDPESPD